MRPLAIMLGLTVVAAAAAVYAEDRIVEYAILEAWSVRQLAVGAQEPNKGRPVTRNSSGVQLTAGLRDVKAAATDYEDSASSLEAPLSPLIEGHAATLYEKMTGSKLDRAGHGESAILSVLGRSGWELTSVVDSGIQRESKRVSHFRIYYFKRYSKAQ